MRVLPLPSNFRAFQLAWTVHYRVLKQRMTRVCVLQVVDGGVTSITLRGEGYEFFAGEASARAARASWLQREGKRGLRASQ